MNIIKKSSRRLRRSSMKVTRDRRNKIVSASSEVAAQLFRERGFDGVSVADLMGGCRAHTRRFLRPLFVEGGSGGRGCARRCRTWIAHGPNCEPGRRAGRFRRSLSRTCPRSPRQPRRRLCRSLPWSRRRATGTWRAPGGNGRRQALRLTFWLGLRPGELLSFGAGKP